MPQIILKTLSPIHIGDGQNYNAFSFLVRGGKLYFIDASVLQETLNQEQMEKLLNWIEEENTPDLEIFLTKYLKDVTLINKVTAKAKYWITLEGQKPRRVFSFIKSGNRVYIPGTEIKGAFRSALLYKLAMEDFSNEILRRIERFCQDFTVSLQVVKNKPIAKHLTDVEFQSIPRNELQKLFSKREIQKLSQRTQEGRELTVGRLKDALAEEMGKVEEQIQNLLFRPFASDAKYDLLRLLQISDCELKSPSEVLQVAPLVFVGLRRKINEAFNYHEVLKEEQTFQFDLQIMNDRFKPDFLKKFRFYERQTKLVENELSLFRCAYEFYDKVLEEEIFYYSKLEGYSKALTELQKIKRQNTPESPVLRLGKHQGFLSLTLALMIKQKDQKLYHDAFVHATKGTSYSLAFPKTRKLVRIGGEELPLGWVKLEK